MKTIKLISKIFLLTLLVYSCSEEDPEFGNFDFSSDNFVSFETNAASINELVLEPLTLTATHAVSRGSASPVSIPFTITSDNAVEGVDYMIIDNKTSFDFTSSDFSDSIQIMPIDNLVADGDKTLTITLSSNSVTTGFPGPDSNNKSAVITIVDNDCAYTLEELGAAFWSGSDDSSGDEGPNGSQITTAYDGTTFTIEGIAYGWLTNTGFWDEVVLVSNPVVADIDLTNGMVTVALQPLCTTTWVGDIQPDYSVEATGSYDSCSETMTISYDLIQGGAILRSYTETITK